SAQSPSQPARSSVPGRPGKTQERGNRRSQETHAPGTSGLRPELVAVAVGSEGSITGGRGRTAGCPVASEVTLHSRADREAGRARHQPFVLLSVFFGASVGRIDTDERGDGGGLAADAVRDCAGGRPSGRSHGHQKAHRRTAPP